MTGLEEPKLGGSGIVRRGMGIICEARQVPLNRGIALKVLASSPELTSKSVLRFQRETAAATKLLSLPKTISGCIGGVASINIGPRVVGPAPRSHRHPRKSVPFPEHSVDVLGASRNPAQLADRTLGTRSRARLHAQSQCAWYAHVPSKRYRMIVEFKSDCRSRRRNQRRSSVRGAETVGGHSGCRPAGNHVY
jgi:hypothetical protein